MVEPDRFAKTMTTALDALSDPLAASVRGALAWRQSDAAKREQAQFGSVIFLAAQQIANGDAEVAAANIDAHCNDPHFRRRVHAAAQEMLAGTPCDDALPLIGALIAAYETRRPATDPLFRNVARLLCDLTPAEIPALVSLVTLLVQFIGGDAAVEVEATPCGKVVALIKARRPGEPRAAANVDAGHVEGLIADLLRHGLVTDVPLLDEHGNLRQHASPKFQVPREALAVLAASCGLGHAIVSESQTPPPKSRY